MPHAPPFDCAGTPSRETVPEATLLWRVHARTRPADRFSSTVEDRYVGGGRFSGTSDCPYPYLYLAFSEETALAETLLRSLPFGGTDRRMVPRAAVSGRRLSAVRTTRPLVLLRLVSTPDLAAVCQDEWLVQAEPRDYRLTRRWACWLRRRNPWAEGFVWQSRRNLGERTVVVFGDRCGAALRASTTLYYDLDDVSGALWLNDRLAAFGAEVAVPEPAPERPRA